jgi:hypothetical protein
MLEGLVLSESRGKGGLAVVEHLRCVLLDLWVGRDVKITHHRIRFPATQELNGVGVDVSTKKGGCTAGPQRTRLNLVWLDTESFGSDCRESLSKSSADIGGSDVGLGRMVEEATERGVRRLAEVAQVSDPADHCQTRTNEGVTAATVGDELDFDSVFLGGET